MQILVGDEHIRCTPVEPYDERVVALLDAWSQAIRGDAEAKAYPDVLSFAFFIRRGSIQKKREAFFGKNSGAPGSPEDVAAGSRSAGFRRIGRGLAFHIAPSNVPVNCMYTLVFGMLSGCANIVRVPGREFPQVDILCRTLQSVIDRPEFSEDGERLQVLRYERDEKLPDGRERTVFFSEICDVRVIWGGDETMAHIRAYPLSPRACEIAFADRYSIGLVSARAVSEASDAELAELARNFYNDTYLMDQNACSTPHLIAWTDAGEADTRQVQERFWEAVAKEAAGRYDLADIKSSEKFAELCEKSKVISRFNKYEGNMLYVCDIEGLRHDLIETARGKFGLFFQCCIEGLDSLEPVVDDPKVQTVAVYGIDTAEVRDWVIDNGIAGVDRVVPFGRTLDIDVVWDGYDLVRTMSRVVAG